MNNRLFVYSCGFASAVFLDVAVGKHNVFGTVNQLHQIFELVALFTVRIQLVQYILKVVVFRIAQDRPLCRFCSCQSQHYPHFRGILLFLVILEPLRLCVYLFYSLTT